MTHSPEDTEKNYKLGKRLIDSAVTIDEALAEMLKLEIKRAKKTINIQYEKDSISNLIRVLRTVIATLILTEEKIKIGMELCNVNDKEGL